MEFDEILIGGAGTGANAESTAAVFSWILPFTMILQIEAIPLLFSLSFLAKYGGAK